MEEFFRLIPDKFAEVITARLAFDKINEVRIRNARPVRIGYDGTYYYLCRNGLTKDAEAAFVAADDEAESIVMRACERSLYTVTDTLRRGYVAVQGGIRIGVCGNGVAGNDGPSAIKDFSSVNIRLPHQVIGCAAGVHAKLMSSGQCNVLLISPPGAGKTTVLRDLCRLISDRGSNVLLCDERYEIASCRKGIATLDVGKCTDIISGVDKREVFEIGIASMRPDVIVTDELFGRDIDALSRAVHCGVSVIATVHARDVRDFKAKAEYADIVEKNIFSQYVEIADTPTRSVKLIGAADV
ncbi:MAG: Flp pilus assembly complex ATPase component TadA [Clostridiales bacterium]|nr:Flp pilus assembly complex ATPase component TadA [Clostridiales bacterium]